MRILNVIYQQNAGGVGQCFLDYGRALVQNGNEVSLVISEHDRLNADYSIFKNVFKLKNFSPILDSLRILAIEKKYKPDFIICHDPRSIRLACNLKFLMRAKVIGVNHGWGYKQSLRAHYIFNVNEPIRSATINAGFDANKTFVVSNMIDMTNKNKFDKRDFHGPPVIGMLGRIEHDKGFDILIEAAKILKKDNMDFSIKIGGFSADNGKFLSDLENMITNYNLKNKVTFVGQVHHKREFFESIDILVVPSRHESFGMVILEGFKYSKPVIASNTDGAKILVRDNENGMIFEILNAQMLSEKLKLLMGNESAAQKLAENGSNDAKNLYSMDIIGQKIHKMLLDILNK